MKAIERHASELAALGHVARLSILLALVQAGPEGMTTTVLQRRIGIPWTTRGRNGSMSSTCSRTATGCSRRRRGLLGLASGESAPEASEAAWRSVRAKGIK